MAKRGSALMKIKYKPSAALAEVLGSKKPLSRGLVVKGLWAYIKGHKLQSKTNGQIIQPDKILSKVLGTKDIKMTIMAKKLGAHLERVV